MSEGHEKKPLFLELGDIIRINAPTNNSLNAHVFFIDYIDNTEIDIVNDTDNIQTNIKIIDGEFTDKSIESIEIISRSETKGFARQNNLITGTWITMRFGGDVPVTINGEITDLEEDMIEITTYPENKKFYIDFAFKGIPRSLPLESIQPFAPPTEKHLEKTGELEEPKPIEKSPDEDVEETKNKEEQDDDTEEIDLSIAVPDIRERLKRVLLDANQIKFGEDLGEITEFVPVAESEKRYGIDTQSK